MTGRQRGAASGREYRQRDRILTGKAGIEEVYNEGKDELYKWRRMGDVIVEDATKKRDRLFEEARADVVDHGKKTGNERLVLLDAKTGEMLDTVNGSADDLILTDAVMALIQDANQSVRLIHNHPSSRSFSKDDLLVSANPGVEILEAIGHDGSEYKGKALVVDRGRLNEQIDAANKEADFQISMAVYNGEIEEELAYALEGHIKNTALAKNGVIEYQANLSAKQKKLLKLSEGSIEKIIEKVLKRLRIIDRFNAQPGITP